MIMRNVLFLFALSLFVLSCDTFGTCEDTDLVGIYSGVETCDVNSAETTFEIYIDNDEVFLRESGGAILELVTDGCDFTIPAQSTLISTISGSGTVSGDNLEVTITSVGVLSGDALTCEFSGDK